MYFLIKGNASMVVKRGPEYYPFILLEQNYYFGEIDLLFSYNKTHLHTVYSETGCELFTLSKEHFENLLQLFEDDAIEICLKARERLDRTNAKKIEAKKEIESRYNIKPFLSIPDNNPVNIGEIKIKARKSVQDISIIKSSSMYTSLIDLKKPENDLARLKKRVKQINLYTLNIVGLTSVLSEFMNKTTRNS